MRNLTNEIIDLGKFDFDGRIWRGMNKAGQVLLTAWNGDQSINFDLVTCTVVNCPKHLRRALVLKRWLKAVDTLKIDALGGFRL